MNKIYYICDWNVEPGYYKYDHHRFPQGYIELMPWFVINWKDVNTTILGNNNIIFANTPCGDEYNKLLMLQELVPNNKVFLFQEGCFWDWFDWPAKEQELYINLMKKCTAFVCNEDVSKEAKIFTQNIVHTRICTNLFTQDPRGWGGNYVFIVNPIKRYQRGMISHAIVRDAIQSDIPIYSMSYNRPAQFNELLAFPDSYSMPGFKLLSRMTPDQWLSAIYGCKFGVDITRDHAGGNTIIEFASMGVPLIGNAHSEVQRDLFPDISFDYYDVNGIKKAIHLLLNDKDFYNDIANKAHKRVIEHWNSEVVVKEFKENLKPWL